jgi:glycosyltransferase involved in cell wall biosynthesis
MAMRRPIVTTRAPGNRETVEEGVNGFLVDEADPAAIASAVERLAATPDLVTRMGDASRVRAVARFDASRVNEGLLRHLGL